MMGNATSEYCSLTLAHRRGQSNVNHMACGGADSDHGCDRNPRLSATVEGLGESPTARRRRGPNLLVQLLQWPATDYWRFGDVAF